MKKVILFFILATISISICGCSDFGFNPTGQWKFVSDNVYDDNGTLIDSALAEDNSILGDMVMVFQKSGIGYIDVVGVRSEEFTYSYDNNSITITYLANEYHDEIEAQFKPSDDGKNIVRSLTTVENGITYVEEFLYKRV